MSNYTQPFLTWVEISKKALTDNLKVIRHIVGNQVIVAPVVKGNAYGHGLIETSKMILHAGADWLSVNALFEAEELRKAGIRAPIYILGYVRRQDIARAIQLDCRLVVYNTGTIDEIARASKRIKKSAKVHIKLETGNNRQGVHPHEVVKFANYILKQKHIVIEGISTHFANLEDRVDTSYAEFQLKNFRDGVQKLTDAGIRIPIHHCASSAAILLLPETHMDLVRPGIMIYGLWPSEKTRLNVQKHQKKFELHPVLSWRTRIAQIKTVDKGASIGYGCTCKTTRKTRLAILPVGYYDGYERGFSNRGSVLIHGKRAPVLGRICMNITMVDVTDIPSARLEDPVTLLGRDGKEVITAEELGETCGTINYEITTRISESIPRVVV